MQRRSLTGTLCGLTVPLFFVSCTHESGAPPTTIATTEMVPSTAADAATGKAAADTSTAEAGSSSPFEASTPPNRGRASLVDHFRWIPLGSEEDPFDDRSADSTCALDGVTVAPLAGELSYDVETGSCSYITATQLSQQPVEVGDLVKVRLWHFDLTAAEPGEGHAVVEIDGQRVLDARVAIPSPGGLVRAELRIDRAIPAGAPIYFHLHNHGQNSWALVEVSTGP
jgi:hypothetical protein